MAEATTGNLKRPQQKGMTRLFKTALVGLGALGAVDTAKNFHQTPQVPNLGETSIITQVDSVKPTTEDQAANELARIIKYKERPELLVKKPVWLELLTTDPKEQETAQKLIDEQMPNVEGIAIDPKTGGPSHKFKEILKYKAKIVQEAKKHGLREDIVMAKFLIEGWLDDSLMPSTARRMGLRVDGSDIAEEERIDERKIPERYIEGMTAALAEQYEFWGDDRDDFPISAFNTGQGGMAEILYEDGLIHGIDLPVPTNGNIRVDSNPYRDYIKQRDLSVYDLITEPRLDPFRTEIFEIYTPRIAAAIKYLQDNNYLPKEYVQIAVPFAQQEPKPRTDEAVV